MITGQFKNSHIGFWSVLISMAIVLAGLNTPALATTPQVSAGFLHTVALKHDGTVWAWGGGGSRWNHGQLGNGSTTDSTIPVQVSGLSDITAIAAGGYHTVALKSDGTVCTWGWNSFGQLGDGSTTDKTTPVQVLGLSGITAIAAGGRYTVALKSDGTLWTWGSNSYGQLGNGTTTGSNSPVQVLGLNGITAVAAGDQHTVAVMNNGTVWTWGLNYGGQLGDGSTTDSSIPVQVSDLSGITAVSAGAYHSVALKNNGTIWFWGVNGDVPGAPGTTQSNSPEQVSGLSDITAIASGSQHTLALAYDGTIWAWGRNTSGQLGNGNTTDSTIPVQVAVLSEITAVAACGYHTVALKSDGTVWGWGANSYGQLGNGATIRSKIPMQVPDLSSTSTVAASRTYTVTLKNDGTLWAWGSNDYGQLGNGTTIASSTPMRVPGLNGITAVAKSYDHTVAVKNDGTVWTWGKNDYGQLGDGTYINSSNPVQILGLSGITAVAAGEYHTVAVKNDGTVWTWGQSDYGQLGTGCDYAYSCSTPVQVPDLSGITAVAAGAQHTVALRSDGTLWAWGRHDNGQLGDGSSEGDRTSTPVQVLSLNEIIAVEAGAAHTVALKNDGTLWAWGFNSSGQLGDGTTSQRNAPVQVMGLNEITAVTTGFEHTAAVKNDGTLWAWGGNFAGQLGNGTTINSTTPVQVSGLSEVTGVTASFAHTVAVKNDGTLWAWGYNYAGQLGFNSGWTPLQALINLGEQQFIATLSAGPNGRINGPITVPAGDMPTYDILPNSGYHVVDVIVNGTSVGAVASYTFTQGITGPVTIAASFAIDTFTVGASVSGSHGTVSPSSQTIEYNSSATINITPDTNYHVASITDNGVQVAINDTYVISNVTTAHFVVVTFAMNPYTFSGFFTPVDNLPIVNTAKAGQAIPIKWQLTDTTGMGVSDPASFLNLTSFSVSCEDFGGGQSDIIEEVSAGNSYLQYNGEGNWQFNWKTPKSYSASDQQCRVMVLNLRDGSQYTANFKFIK